MVWPLVGKVSMLLEAALMKLTGSHEGSGEEKIEGAEGEEKEWPGTLESRERTGVVSSFICC